jgi:hypothetical protein
MSSIRALKIHTELGHDHPLVYFLFASSSDLIPNCTNLATLLAISIVMSSGTKKKGI